MEMNEKHDRLSSLLDLFGADLNDWPDSEAAQQARAAALSDPEFRLKLEAAKRIDRSFSALSTALERAPDMEKRLADIQSAVLETIEPQAQRKRAFSRRSLMRLAASVVIACGLGVGAGQIIPDQPTGQPDALDQLLLGSYDGRNGD